MIIVFSGNFRTITNSVVSTKLGLLGTSFTALHIVILATSVLVSVILITIYNKTTFGKAVKAVSDNEEVSKIVGIIRIV